MSRHEHFEQWKAIYATTPVAIVEASSYETLCLWREYHVKCKWNDYSKGGPGVEVGRLDGRPIMVFFSAIKLNDKVVVLYEATSQVVDFVKVEHFVSEEWPTTTKSTASDFYNVFWECTK